MKRIVVAVRSGKDHYSEFHQISSGEHLREVLFYHRGWFAAEKAPIKI
jgi:hypothetical protein